VLTDWDHAVADLPGSPMVRSGDIGFAEALGGTPNLLIRSRLRSVHLMSTTWRSSQTGLPVHRCLI
jgi:hypothetical protein